MVEFKNFLQHFAQERFIVDAENPDRDGLCRLWLLRRGIRLRRPAKRKDHAHERAFARLAFDFDCPLVALHHAVNHRQTETGAAALPLRRKERFQTTLARLFIHADSVVTHLENKMTRFFGVSTVKTDRERGHGNQPAVRQSVHRVQQNISQCFPQLAFIAVEIGQRLFQLGFYLDHDSLALRDILPARTGHFDRLLDEPIDIHQPQFFVGFPPAVKLAHPPHGLRNVFACRADMLQILSRTLLQVDFLSQNHLRERQDRRQGIINVVRDAAGHLAQRAQTLLLHD